MRRESPWSVGYTSACTSTMRVPLSVTATWKSPYFVGIASPMIVRIPRVVEVALVVRVSAGGSVVGVATPSADERAAGEDLYASGSHRPTAAAASWLGVRLIGPR